MTNLLSAISGKFSTALVLGTFFPVVVFVLLFRLLVVPFFPAEMELGFLAPLQKIDSNWEPLVLFFGAVVLSGLLYNLNVAHVRLYEGYPWEESWLGFRRKQRFRRETALLEAQQAACPHVLATLSRERDSLQVAAGSEAALDQLRKQISAVEQLRNPYEFARLNPPDRPLDHRGHVLGLCLSQAPACPLVMGTDRPGTGGDPGADSARGVGAETVPLDLLPNDRR